MRILGLVTARGGSKGLPDKNLARIAGRPLAAWSHRALAGLRRGLRGTDTELVLRLSTDSPAIAAAWPAADRPDPSKGDLRPDHLATDTATSLDVVLYELDRMARTGTPCDGVLLLQPTSPLLNTHDLLRLLGAFRASPDRANASAALIAELDHPLAWSLTLASRGDGARVITPATDFDPSQRQAHDAVYRPVGCYCCSADFLRTKRAFCVPGITAGVPIPTDRAIDIDTKPDLETARAMIVSKAESASITLETHTGARTVGPGHPCFVIAEAGVNHNGEPDLARALIDAAADAGADAVKFQSFRANELVTDAAAMASYQRTNLNIDADAPSTQADMLRALELADTELARLKAHAESRGLVFLSSPFDTQSARVLADLGVCALKLGSGELTNHPFLADLATLGLPLLLSTGMATLDECEAAADHLRAHAERLGQPAPETLWFHCVSAYPAPADATNLRAMDTLRTALCAPVGMSDHSMGDAVAIAAVARGAVSIEKHLTLDRTMAGPDHAASLEPEQFGEMVRRIRTVESALGDGVKSPAACEADTIIAARRSLVAARDLPAGHTVGPDDLVAKRPGDGISPARYADLIGRTLANPLQRDRHIAESDLTLGNGADGRSVA